MYICIYTCIHTHIYIYIYIYIHMYVCRCKELDKSSTEIASDLGTVQEELDAVLEYYSKIKVDVYVYIYIYMGERSIETHKHKTMYITIRSIIHFTYIYIYIYIHTHIYMYIYMYIYIYIHICSYMYMYRYIYIYIYICTHIIYISGRVRRQGRAVRGDRGCIRIRRREHMVGVSMVLAEYIKFKQGLNRTMFTPTMFSRGRSMLTNRVNTRLLLTTRATMYYRTPSL